MDAIILAILFYSFKSMKWIMYCVLVAYIRYNMPFAFFSMYFEVNENSYCDPNSMNTVTLMTTDSFQTVLMFLAISNTKLLNFLVILGWVGGSLPTYTNICEPTEVAEAD